MYLPAHFAVDDLETRHALIRDNPLGLLVTSSPEGPVADPIPFVLDPAGGALGTLRAHVARANPLWKTHDAAVPALVVFTATDAYVSPSWYATKREHGKVVPTWNYATVHARGTMRVIEDADWLAAQIAALTEVHEGRRPEPWSVADAPETFVRATMRGIVGIEIEITHLDGKWKVSQNRPEADRQGVAEGLDADGADAMAGLVRRFGGI